jgi:hypothetical protein
VNPTVTCIVLAYQPPAGSTFLSEQTSHQYFSLRINQYQPSATSQTNRCQAELILVLFRCVDALHIWVLYHYFTVYYTKGVAIKM